MTLAGIGIQTDAERVYRFVLARRGCLSADVAAGLGLAPDAVAAALRVLADAELVRTLPERGLSAIDPAIGVERLIEERLARLNEEPRATAAVRGVLSELTALRGGVRSAASPAEVEKVKGPEDVRRRLAELAFAAHRDVLVLQPGAMLTTPGTREPVQPPDPRGLRRGVELRTVVHTEAVADRGIADHLLELVDLGAAIRAADHPMDWMIVFDRAVLALPFDPAFGARGAVIVRQPDVAASMVGLFEQVWDRATDVRSLAGCPVAALVPSALDRQVLRLLMETDTDEAGARRLHVSLRTYRRYVARLLKRLGAANRFQAAARAKDLHWI
jgi:DNA-binding CsgD family transcriptional regulator/DNA-binding transcriptional ArsR family regulator